MSFTGDSYGVNKSFVFGVVVVAVIVIAIITGVFFWYWCRIQPAKGEFAVMMNKTGKDITNDMILAPNSDYKGIQQEVILGPSREFKAKSRTAGIEFFNGTRTNS